MSTDPQRLRVAIRRLERTFPDVSLATVSGRVEILERIRGPLAMIEQGIQDLVEALQPRKSTLAFLQGPERADSLISALESLVRDRGCGLFPTDSLHSAVVDHARAQDKAWWHGQPAGLVPGLLREESEIIQTLGRRGILVWEGAADAINAGDELWRLVDTRWLTAHADIRRFVLEPWEGGRRCRFCRMQETPQARELHVVDYERRRGVSTVNGVVVVPVGGLTHAPCRSHWLDWVVIASKYATQEAAEAADAAENRTPRPQKPSMPMLELERPFGEPPPREFPADPERA